MSQFHQRRCSCMRVYATKALLTASFYLFLICRITSEDIKNQESKLRFVPCLSSFSRFGSDNFARPRSWSISESIKLYNTAGSGGVVLCSLQPHPSWLTAKAISRTSVRLLPSDVCTEISTDSVWVDLTISAWMWLIRSITASPNVIVENRVSPPPPPPPPVPTALCSHSSMFPQLYVPTTLYISQFYYSHSSAFPQLCELCVPTALYSHSSIFPQLCMSTVLCSHSSMFPQLYVPTALHSHSSVCSHSSMFSQFNVPTALYSHSSASP